MQKGDRDVWGGTDTWFPPAKIRVWEALTQLLINPGVLKHTGIFFLQYDSPWVPKSFQKVQQHHWQPQGTPAGRLTEMPLWGLMLWHFSLKSSLVRSRVAEKVQFCRCDIGQLMKELWHFPSPRAAGLLLWQELWWLPSFLLNVLIVLYCHGNCMLIMLGYCTITGLLLMLEAYS